MFFGLEMAVLRVHFFLGVLHQCYKIPGNMEGHVQFSSFIGLPEFAYCFVHLVEGTSLRSPNNTQAGL